MSAIILDQVSKRFANGVQALAPLTLTIEPGSFVVVLGPSGAGKSTLLRLINGLESPTTGSAVVDGLPVTRRHLRRVRGRVGMVFQQFQLVGRLNVMTNVLTGCLARVPAWMSLLHLFRREDVDLAAHALARVRLTAKAWERADRLSGGEQQRVAIARTLVQRPKVILADEPVASLDPVTGGEVLNLLAEIHREEGVTLVVNLHQVEPARRHAERVLGLRAGRLVFDGPPTDLTPAALDAIYGPVEKEAADAVGALADP